MLNVILLLIFVNINLIHSFNSNNEILYNKKDKLYYLIVNNTYCQLDEQYYDDQIKFFGFNQSNVRSIRNIEDSNLISNEYVDCPIKYVNFGTSYCESYKYKVLYRFKYLTNNLNIIESITNIGSYFNPSIIPFHGKILLMQRKEPYFLLTTRQFNEFKLLRYKLNEDFRFEADNRLLHVPSRKEKGVGYILIVFAYEKYNGCCVYTGIRKLNYNINNHTYTISDPLKLDYNQSSAKEKNWSPFQYKNDVYFIERINPFHVLRMTNKPIYQTRFVYRDYPSQEVVTVSKSICKDESSIRWDYGEIRGGTQATHIYGYGYLAFFHSFITICHRYYFIGAYVFSNTIPFKLLKMSFEPIVKEDLIIDLRKGIRHMSVIFPMSFYFEDERGNMVNGNNVVIKPHKIVLSAGYNDTDGIIIKLDFDNFMLSLKDVDC